MDEFNEWFSRVFGVDAPDDFIEFLQDADGEINGVGATIYSPQDIIDHTEERSLEEKRLLLIGFGEALTHVIFDVDSGVISVVDKTDYSLVDVWFKSVSSLSLWF